MKPETNFDRLHILLTVSKMTQYVMIATVVAAGLAFFGTSRAMSQSTCTSAQDLETQRKALADADEAQKKAFSDEALKQRDCWAAKLKKGEKSLSGAFLPGADLGRNQEPKNEAESQPPNYQNVDLTNANLVGANLISANLKGAKLAGADLTGAVLSSGADLTNAILTGANLTSADLRNAEVDWADFSSADLRGADLSGWGFLSLEDKLAEMEKEDGRPPTAEERKKFEQKFAEDTQIRTRRERESRSPLVNVNGAKASKTTKGITAAVWKERGGVIVD